MSSEEKKYIYTLKLEAWVQILPVLPTSHETLNNFSDLCGLEFSSLGSATASGSQGALTV